LADVTYKVKDEGGNLVVYKKIHTYSDC